MHVEIKTIQDPTLRVKIVEERMSFDQSPLEWLERYQKEQNLLQEKLISAQRILPQVKIKRDYQIKISQICSDLNIEGLRGDLVTSRAAKAFAAFDNRFEVTSDDIYQIISFCLTHRLRNDVLSPMSSTERVKKAFLSVF
jgi:magnesium chelatase subunit I